MNGALAAGYVLLRSTLNLFLICGLRLMFFLLYILLIGKSKIYYIFLECKLFPLLYRSFWDYARVETAKIISFIHKTYPTI